MVDSTFAVSESAEKALVTELLSFDLLLLHVRFGQKRPAPLDVEFGICPDTIPDCVCFELTHVAALRGPTGKVVGGGVGVAGSRIGVLGTFFECTAVAIL